MCGSPSGEQRGEPASPPPHLSSSAQQAALSQDKQNKPPPSFSFSQLLLFLLLYFLVIFILYYLSYSIKLRSLSHLFASNLLFFVQSVFSFISSSTARLFFCLCPCHLPSFHLLLAVHEPYFLLLFSCLLFFALFTTFFLYFSQLLFLYCYIYLFNMMHLHWFVALHSPFLHCDFPSLLYIFPATTSLTLDIFHFSSSYSYLSLHSLH